MNDEPKSDQAMDLAQREELDGGLRFLHAMGMQTKLELGETSSRAVALIEELVEQGVIDPRRLEERYARVKAREEVRTANQHVVRVSESVDKYALEDLPQIDCASRLHLCKARCCKLHFPLSFQDLDEGVLRWRYEQPYVIRQREDGYCVHNCGETGQCTVHAQRPAVCRLYDCRRDERIWIDFEQRIPVPDEAPLGQTATGPTAANGQGGMG